MWNISSPDGAQSSRSDTNPDADLHGANFNFPWRIISRRYPKIPPLMGSLRFCRRLPSRMRLDAPEAAAPVFLPSPMPLSARGGAANPSQSAETQTDFFFFLSRRPKSSRDVWSGMTPPSARASGKQADGFRVERTRLEITRGATRTRGDKFIRAARKQICPGNSKRMSTLNQNSGSIQRVLRGNISISLTQR